MTRKDLCLEQFCGFILCNFHNPSQQPGRDKQQQKEYGCVLRFKTFTKGIFPFLNLNAVVLWRLMGDLEGPFQKDVG